MGFRSVSQNTYLLTSMGLDEACNRERSVKILPCKVRRRIETYMTLVKSKVEWMDTCKILGAI